MQCNKKRLKRRGKTVWCLETKSIRLTVREENHKVRFVLFKESGFEDSGILLSPWDKFLWEKKSLLVNCSQGDPVGLEFKQEMSTAEMSAEENNVNAF